MNFYDNLKTACNNKGLKVTPFIEMFGLNSANTGAWKKGGHPGIDKLIEISDILNVSIDHLLGREVVEESTIIPTDGLNPKIQKISNILETGDIPDTVIDFIYKALENYKK